MAIIKPFKGITPTIDNAPSVVSRPFDFYSKEQIEIILENDPLSFLHVIVPEHRDENKSEPNSVELFRKSKAQFNNFIEKGILVQDSKPSLYVYRQIIQDKSHTGIIGCASVEDYNSNIIRKHEHTITEREEILKNYLRVCDINAEPVCMTYRDSSEIDTITEKLTTKEPDFNFITADSIRHQIWKINSENDLSNIVSAFSKIQTIYIADGHHRCASSALLAEEMKAQNPKHTGEEAYNYFMAIYFPDNELRICEYNRLVKNLNGISTEDLLSELAKNFTIEDKGKEIVKPASPQVFSLYINQNWYLLELKDKTLNKGNPVKSLDVSILNELILQPLLGIEDQRTDKRIGFISGTKGVTELIKKVDSGKWEAAFKLFPVQGKQLYEIADGGFFMPPKSTWIEPKLRSGMIVYSLELM